MKAVVAAFNQEKALVGAFSVIVQLYRLTDLRHYKLPSFNLLHLRDSFFQNKCIFHMENRGACLLGKHNTINILLLSARPGQLYTYRAAAVRNLGSE